MASSTIRLRRPSRPEQTSGAPVRMAAARLSMELSQGRPALCGAWSRQAPVRVAKSIQPRQGVFRCLTAVLESQRQTGLRRAFGQGGKQLHDALQTFRFL